MDSPFNRLQCYCVFTDSAKKLAKKMDALPDKPGYEELRTALHDLRAEHAQHVTTHNQQYARAFIEYHRIDERPILKTTAFSAGDVKRARDPVKKSKGRNKGGGGGGEKPTRRRKKVAKDGGADGGGGGNE